MSDAKRNRYPGAQPFEKEHKDLFFGREKAIADLYRKVKLEQLVVLYSKSGLGKSSLLNAGIIPTAEKEGKYMPVRIRLGAWTKRETRSPLQISLGQIMNGPSSKTFLDKLIPDEPSLWHEVKEFQITQMEKKESTGLLLIFDQFEELFTYPAEGVVEFKKQLKEALVENLPQRYADELEKHFDRNEHVLTPDELDNLQIKPDLKIIFAIRSDRMSLLDGLSDYLPTILKNCFELAALDNVEASRAIVEPAHMESDEFLTPPFRYSQEALDEILKFLSKSGSQRIESFQLQILCQSIEEKVKRKNQLIGIEDLGDVENLYENYYDNQIERLEGEHERMTARALIEDGLIYSAEERRLSLYEGVIEKEYNVSRETLQKLVNCHLLRAEPSMQGGGYTYELSHDTLVKPVLQSRKRRREALREQNTILYENLIDMLPEDRQLPVRKLIEEDMIVDVEERRIMLFEAQVLREIDRETLKKLLDIGLLRGEHTPQGGFQYQLAGEDMVTGVLASKQKRLEQEALQAEEEARREQERQLEEMRLKAEEEERKRQEAERLKKEAEDARAVAEQEKAEADRQRQRALDSQKEAETERDRAEAAQKEAEFQKDRALAAKRRANLLTIITAVLFVGASIAAFLAWRNAKTANEAKERIIEETLKTDRMLVEERIKRAGTLREKYPESAKELYEQSYGILNNPNYSDKPEVKVLLDSIQANIARCQSESSSN